MNATSKVNLKWPLSRKTFCLITGASRGLGKVLAIKFGARLAEESVLFLLARDAAGLEATRAEVQMERQTEGLRVHVAVMDLSKPDTEAFTIAIRAALGGHDPNTFEDAVVIHNAATSGHPRRAKKCDDPMEWASYMALNLTSAVCLNSVFLETFAAVRGKLVINVSSLAAIQPCSGLSMYCSGKAARDLYFGTLAIEEPEITVVNYAPGPLYTDMYYEVIEMSKDSDLPTAEQFQKRVDDGVMLTCEQTTERLLEILESGGFTSGQHVDYYDEHWT